ncbi:haloalkane dehalogenase [Larkinella rosea]|uniref:Haloalkane dehalogenase n=1 Tax=Larkinella rosea TaxID=2025312 RepID=A0A3P1BU33_9BACT|nr:haloalkane dehalogenase [Larkinella rosea]RRB04413.1 haloalkane dehalogenase [Larkinella rosea]
MQTNDQKNNPVFSKSVSPFPKKRQQVFGHEMAYVETGSGDPIVFLHGNPTSSYIWRNIIPHVQPFGRCIAPDLMGMGDSDKLPNDGPETYAFVDHRRYLDQFLAALSITERITFVVHDWGAALAFDWAYRHPTAVKGIAYMEPVVTPRTWSELSEVARRIFQALRSPAGEQLVLQENSFIEVNLPATILRRLSNDEWTEYRRPFAEPGESRRPMLTWARQLPIDGEPADVTQIVTTFGNWMAQNSIPKLFIQANPGTLSADTLNFCRSWPEQTVVTVPGHHHLQEDSPDEIGRAISDWLKKRERS